MYPLVQLRHATLDVQVAQGGIHCWHIPWLSAYVVNGQLPFRQVLLNSTKGDWQATQDVLEVHETQFAEHELHPVPLGYVP